MARKNVQREVLVQEQKKKQQRTLLIVLGVVVVLVAVFVLAKALTTFKPWPEFTRGSADAPVEVLVFSDFRCSHCADFALNQEEKFLSEYADTGKVRYTFINHPFMSNVSMDAAIAVTCAAEQGQFWPYQKELFNHYHEDFGYSAANLQAYAQKLNLDLEKFNTCSAAESTRSYINKGMLYGGKLGVTGTPSFVVNGKVVYSNALVQTVEEALAAAK